MEKVMEFELLKRVRTLGFIIRLEKQHFCTCITLFCTFLCRRYTATAGESA